MTWYRIFRLANDIGRSDFHNFWSSWRVWLATHALRVATTAATWILLGRLLGSDATVRFLFVGQVIIVGAHFAGWALQAFTWDRAFSGTYPMLVASPSSLVPAMVGRTTVWLLNGVATSLVTLVMLLPVFGASLPLDRVAVIIPLVVLTCTSAYAFAFCLGSLITWAPRLRNIVQNLTVTLMTGICGVVVPVTFWPVWVQRVASVMPVTHGLTAIRLTLDGGSPRTAALQALAECMVALGWFLAGMVTLDLTVNLARRNGAIDIG